MNATPLKHKMIIAGRGRSSSATSEAVIVIKRAIKFAIPTLVALL